MDYNIFGDVVRELVGIYNLCKDDTCTIAVGIGMIGITTGTLVCIIPEYFQTRKANKILKKNELERGLN